MYYENHCVPWHNRNNYDDRLEELVIACMCRFLNDIIAAIILLPSNKWKRFDPEDTIRIELRKKWSFFVFKLDI